MREIVRMTAQKQPLEVGVPLYPFSHTTLFRKDQPPSDEAAGAAPLPVSPHDSYEQHTLPVHIPTVHALSPNGSTMITGPTWPHRDVSGSPATANYAV